MPWQSWENAGGHYGCGEFSPSPNDVDFGVSYTQSRNCSLDQSRSRTVVNEFRSGNQQFVRTEVQEQTISVSESVGAVGTKRNWQPTASTFTAWEDVGAQYGFQAWAPSVSQQMASFEQVRVYSQDQVRTEQKRERDLVTGDLKNVGEPIQHEQTVPRNEARNVTVTYSEWLSGGAVFDCDTFTPAINVQQNDFSQSRECSRNQGRERIYRVGGEEILRASETQVVSETQSQTVNVSNTLWVDEAALNYSAWSPLPNEQKSDYSQSRSFEQKQARTWEYSTGGASVQSRVETRTLTGQSETRTVTVERTTGEYGEPWNYSAWSPAAAEQTGSFSQSRSYYRTRDVFYTHSVNASDIHVWTLPETKKDYSESRTVTVSYSDWENSSSPYNCGEWSALDLTNTTTQQQSRSCLRDQERTRLYSSGESVVESRTTNGHIQNRSVRAFVGSWRDTTRTSLGAWSPVAAEQTSDFNQSRSYTQNQTATITYMHGANHVGDSSLTRSVPETESRVVAVEFSDWANVSEFYGWGSFVGMDWNSTETQSVTQEYNVDQERVRSYSSGESFTESRTVRETRPLTVEATVGPWVDSGASSFGEWSPVADRQTENFTQNRTRNRVQTAEITYNVGSWVSETKGETSKTTQESEERSVTVDGSGWRESSPGSCTEWEHDAFTSNPATRTCSVDQVQDFFFFVDNGDEIHQNTSYRTWNDDQTSTITSTTRTVEAPSWEDYGNSANCTQWSPSADTVDAGASFTQSRTCDQPQRRRYTVEAQYTNGLYYPQSEGFNTQTRGATESRQATGTKEKVEECTAGGLMTRTETYFAYTDNQCSVTDTTWVFNGNVVYQSQYSTCFGYYFTESGSQQGFNQRNIRFIGNNTITGDICNY